MIAAAVSGLNGRRALPALILGSSVFLQLHLVLGLLFGPVADQAFNQAKGPALAAVAVLVAGALIYWRVRRRRRMAAPAAWTEAACPACVGLSVLAGRVPDLAGLSRLDPEDPAIPAGRPGPGPDDEPNVLVR